MRQSLLILAVLLGAAGCSLLRASPAPDTGFLPDAETLAAMKVESPFNGLWYSDLERLALLKREYNQIAILPVDTAYLEAEISGSRASDSAKREYIEDVREIARYLRGRFVMALERYPDLPLKVVEEAGPKTFVLEVALVELDPTDPLVNTIGTAAGVFVPGGGLIKIAGKGSIAIEALLRDGGSGAILAQFKDRRSDKLAPFTIRDFQKYAHARGAIEDWAREYAELVANPLGHKIDGALPFTLNPL
jgi:hypothetical protein